MKELFSSDRISDNVIADIESRDVALWMRSIPRDEASRPSYIRFFRLPWRFIVTEATDEGFLSSLTQADSVTDGLTRKRGFVQLIDSDPSRIELPNRSLPLYLLAGRKANESATYEDRLRRLTMLDSIRRSAPRSMLIVDPDGHGPLPPDLKDVWSSGFRSQLIFVSTPASAAADLKSWLDSTSGTSVATLLAEKALDIARDVIKRYDSEYPEERIVIRLRDHEGQYHSIDVSDAQDPERPITDSYTVIEQRHLHVLAHEELSKEDFQQFFVDPTSSWKPYAAGLPWMRNSDARTELRQTLDEIHAEGSDEDTVAYVSSQPGAGGTTMVRSLAWECAKQGYPVLIAKPVPFTADALPVMNFIKRVQELVHHQVKRANNPGDDQLDVETPWVVVFDTIHRIADVVKFRNELARYGRRACVLAVTESLHSLDLLNARKIKPLATLDHAISREEARALGEHLNRFLKTYGNQREMWQWDRFYDDHTVQMVEGIATFWVALSFWIQWQYDLSESIQEWIYKRYKKEALDYTLKQALIRIAALTSERLPLPDVLLPKQAGEWPVSLLLEDRRSALSSLGLIRITSDGRKYWALAHDVLGRYLLNALFYDAPERSSLGYADAGDAEHLRFLVLRDLSREPVLGESDYRAIGEDFATSIFKIDPDRGFSSFVSRWKEVLQALDQMPQALRNISRLFRHHCAISRRRIAKIEYLDIPLADRAGLVKRAIEDLEYALNYIDYTPRSESDLNLYNSLANAYFDLANLEGQLGADAARLDELRSRANEATRRAYAESPTNSYVIETIVKNLLNEAKFHSDHPVEQCVEALGILFSAMTTNETAYRAAQLGLLAEEALQILLVASPAAIQEKQPTNPTEVLVQAWRALVSDGGGDLTISDLPRENWEAALRKLEDPAGRGNLLVIRFTYDLLCLASPLAYKGQLELLEQLQGTDYRMAPQLRLEYAVLLFQNGRGVDGAKLFRSLRQVWRQTDQYADVPERLRWLRNINGDLQVVEAVGGSEAGLRMAAIVAGFGQTPIPLRPEEFGLRTVTPRDRLKCHVSFTRFGPFLRPVNIGPRQANRP